jgi:hypothetical protein
MISSIVSWMVSPLILGDAGDIKKNDDTGEVER